MKAAEWIDRVKVSRHWDSDYRVAKELGLSKQTIGSYRGRIATMDEDSAVKVAAALQIDVAVILADQAMERAKNDTARSAWASVLAKLGGVAAGVLVAVGMSSPLPAEAAELASISGQSVYYVKSRRRKNHSTKPRIDGGWPPFWLLNPA